MTLKDVQRVLSRVMFADGSIRRVCIQDEEALLTFNDWREDQWQFRFTGVVLLKAYEFYGSISGIQLNQQSALVQKAIAVIESNGGRAVVYQDLMHLCFLGDEPVVHIVFEGLEIQPVISAP